MSDFTMELKNETSTAKETRSTSNSTKIQNNSIKKAKERTKMCVTIPQKRIPMVLSEFRQNTELCDGIIICDDNVEIPIHRVILSSVSSYFKAHFTNTLNRASEIIEAKVNVPSHIFTKLLDFAYTGHCTIEEDNVEPLLRAADQYCVLGVVELCSRYILDRLQPTKCLEILRFARQYFSSGLEKEGKRYIAHNFPKLLNEGKEFDELTAAEVVEILEDDELNVRSEEFVYTAARRWINVNPEERKMHLLSLLKCIRMGKLSREFLEKDIFAWSLVAENVECQSYLIGIMDVINNARNDEDIHNVIWRPRVPYDIIFAIGGWSYESLSNLIETHDPRADRWLLSADTDDVPRAWHGVCALNGYIYMIAGCEELEVLNTVRRFDAVNHKWSECACLHYPRNFVSVVMHDNKIYAMGGSNGRIRMSSAERYDPRYNQWELIKPMQMQRADAGSAVLNDKIYIVGGENENNQFMSSAEVYDTLADQWTFIPSMLSPRAGVSLVAFKNTIYALGGERTFSNSLATGEKFIPGVSTRWEPIKEMFRQRSHFATAVLDDIIFVLGGTSDNTDLNYVECYDTDTNEWMHASPMNTERSGLTACVLSGLPNARDYSLMGRSKEVGQGVGTHQDVLTD